MVVLMSDCSCYVCSSPVYRYDENGHQYVYNNLHGRLQPCEDCGRLKTEYVDLGTKGYYKCWWCTKRYDG